MTEDWRAGGFGIYLHWPYCEAKCPYCDFNSHVSRNIDHPRWRRAYLSEIERYRARVPDRVVHSIFFGGGTPSLMEPDTVASIIEHIRTAWPMANDVEITLEANPGSVEAGRFAAFADAGVNRISMGIQALNDDDLRRLGRLHSAAEARSAYGIARKYFNRVSFDLIYARQDQTVAQWRQELKDALSMAVDHLSLYQLTIEPGTTFGDRHAKGLLRGLPNDDRAVALFDATQDLCTAAGLPAYEVSNHARPGAQSRHNLIYWRYGDYLGIGPGAHGRLTLNGRRVATEAWSNPKQWLEAAETAANCYAAFDQLSSQEEVAEFLLMGLRLSEGIALDRLARLSGGWLPDEELAQLQTLGMIETPSNRLCVTEKGRLVLNSVIEKLLQQYCTEEKQPG